MAVRSPGHFARQSMDVSMPPRLVAWTMSRIEPVLAALSEHGARVRLLCFTNGEASTLGDTDRPLGEVRTEELDAAAGALGVDEISLLAYPDGHLDQVPVEELTDLVDEAAGSAQLLLVFDEGGITGHADHRRATEAAVLAAKELRLPVLGWALPDTVAQLNTELGTGFVGRTPEEFDFALEVDRVRQHDAIARHVSQSDNNLVLWRRLELLGNQEHLRWLARG